jgi:hypothetical protein
MEVWVWSGPAMASATGGGDGGKFGQHTRTEYFSIISTAIYVGLYFPRGKEKAE